MDKLKEANIDKNSSTGSVSGAIAPASQKKVLIVDDESVIRWSLKKFFDEEGFATTTASSGIKALKIIEEEDPEIVILDVHLPDHNGLALLKTIKETKPDITVIMVTGHADVRSSVEAMKMGALDYLEKPFDFDNLRKILSSFSIKAESSGGKKLSQKDDFIFSSEKMKEVLRIMERLATKSDVTVLVLGESGTGKNMLCKKLHELSPRNEMPFVEVGCVNIPDHLIESELFGHEKGSFTDAKNAKKGLIEMADGGTVFLDEIGDMPYQMQPKILSLIEEKKFRRIGGLKYIHADVRICTATNRNLQELVEAKKFRLDLFYRLNVATIEIPPLRERREDIHLLVNYFLGHYSDKYQCVTKSISPKAMNFLEEYAWPGNVRELKNLIEKTVLFAKGEAIDIIDIPQGAVTQKYDDEFTVSALKEKMDIEAPPGMSLKAMEEAFIKTALKLSEGNQRKAARLLEISRDTLRYRLKKLGIVSKEIED